MADRLAGAWKRRPQGSDRGYDHPTKVITRERDGHPVANVMPLPRPNIAGGHMLTLTMDGLP